MLKMSRDTRRVTSSSDKVPARRVRYVPLLNARFPRMYSVEPA